MRADGRHAHPLTAPASGEIVHGVARRDGHERRLPVVDGEREVQRLAGRSPQRFATAFLGRRETLMQTTS